MTPEALDDAGAVIFDLGALRGDAGELADDAGASIFGPWHFAVMPGKL
jgi:hypothetical protein